MKIQFRSSIVKKSAGALALLAGGYMAATAITVTAQAPIPTIHKYYIDPGAACIGVSSFEYVYVGYDGEEPVKKTATVNNNGTLIVDTEIVATGDRIFCIPQTYETNQGNECHRRDYKSVTFVDTYNGVYEREACRTMWYPPRTR